MSGADDQFKEVQTKYVDAQKQYKSCRQQVQMHERERQTKQLTLQELEKIPADATIYKATGRMFLLASKEVVEGEMATDMTQHDEKLSQLGVSTPDPRSCVMVLCARVCVWWWGGEGVSTSATWCCVSALVC